MRRLLSYTASFLFFVSSGNLHAQESDTPVRYGYYETADDFLNDNIKPFDIVKKNSNTIWINENGEKVKMSAKDFPYWGFRQGDVVYRKGDKYFMGILQTGKIMVYAHDLYRLAGELTYEMHSVYVSRGLDGELIELNDRSTFRLLEEWFRSDDPELADRYAKESKFEFMSTINMILRYIREYNEGYLEDHAE